MFQSVIGNPPNALGVSMSENNLQALNTKEVKMKTQKNGQCSPHPGPEINFQRLNIQNRENSYSFKIFNFAQTPTPSSKNLQTPTRMARIPTTPVIESKK